jgi:hypothetical protein
MQVLFYLLTYPVVEPSSLRTYLLNSHDRNRNAFKYTTSKHGWRLGASADQVDSGKTDDRSKSQTQTQTQHSVVSTHIKICRVILESRKASNVCTATVSTTTSVIRDAQALASFSSAPLYCFSSSAGTGAARRNLVLHPYHVQLLISCRS